MKTYLSLKISVVWAGILALKPLIEFVMSLICFCISEIFKTSPLIFFSVQNNLLSFCMCAVNSQRLFVVGKLVLNVGIEDKNILRILMF